MSNDSRLPWSEETRENLRKFEMTVAAPWRENIRLAREMLAGRMPPNVEGLLQSYINGVGSYYDANRFQLRRLTDEVGRSSELLGQQDSFFDRALMVSPQFIDQHCPELAPATFRALPNTDLESLQILEPSPNDVRDIGFPANLGPLIRARRRPAFHLYATDNALVYIHPFQYQVMTRDRTATWASASPRALSKLSIPDLHIEDIDRDIIIIQDRFSFANLCHFLYDGVTRMLHYTEIFGPSDNSLFVLGGIPHQYHAIVCATLTEFTGIDANSLYFPTIPRLFTTKRNVCWFSDQHESPIPPAQMAHPRSVSLLRTLAARLPGSQSSARRIYISRADTSARKITNEEELVIALEKRGFISVRLAELPPEAQIALFREANTVVGAHGQGLTHIIVGGQLSRMIELFNPMAGTAAYAFMARAGGIHYDFVLGTPVPESRSLDFRVDVERILDLVGPENVPVRAPRWHRSCNLVPSSRCFQGFVNVKGGRSQISTTEMVWGQLAYQHRRNHNVEVGRWPDLPVSPGKVFTASCWVNVDEDFAGSVICVRIADWPEQSVQLADLGKRNCWQRIWATGTAPYNDAACWVSLNIEGPQGSTVATTCWQFERGAKPTAYVAT